MCTRGPHTHPPSRMCTRGPHTHPRQVVVVERSPHAPSRAITNGIRTHRACANARTRRHASHFVVLGARLESVGDDDDAVPRVRARERNSRGFEHALDAADDANGDDRREPGEGEGD